MLGWHRSGFPSVATSSMATKRFEEMLSFLQALKETSESSTVAATQEKMMRGCLKDLELGPPVSIAAAQTMLENLGKAGLPASMQSAIAAAISDKVAAPDAQAADPEARAQKPRKSQQCHRYLQHFLCESDWKSLQGHAAFQAKQQTLAKRLVAMGLTNPTEGTYVLGVAVLYLSQHAGPAETLQVSPQDALSTLEDLKGKLRAWAKRGTHSGLSEYPKEPKELPQQLYNTAFAVEGPASCPLDEGQLLALADWLPARKSKATLLVTKHARSMFEGMPSQVQQQMWMMQMQLQAAQAHTDDNPLPGLTFLPRKAKQPQALQNASASSSPEKEVTPKLHVQRNSLQRNRPPRQACFSSSRSWPCLPQKPQLRQKPESPWTAWPNSSSNTCKTSARSRATRTGSRAKLPRRPKQPPKRRQSRNRSRQTRPPRSRAQRTSCRQRPARRHATPSLWRNVPCTHARRARTGA